MPGREGKKNAIRTDEAVESVGDEWEIGSVEFMSMLRVNFATLLTTLLCVGLLNGLTFAQAADSVSPNGDSEATMLLDRDGALPRVARDEAARRLAARGTPEARNALLRALQEAGNPAAQQSAATGLASGVLVDPTFVDPLFVLVSPDVPMDIARPAATALAIYSENPVVLTRLIDRTADRRGEPSRRAAIEALGAVPEKRAAATLMGLLGSEDESRDVRLSAVAALNDMTGLLSNGNDLGRWQTWWDASRALDDASFRNALLGSKASRYDRLKAQQDQLVAAIAEQLTQMYRALPPERREAQLLSMLGDGSPAIRSIGAQVVQEEKASAAVIPDSVRDRLGQMVGDADPSVRITVADTLRALNHAPALEALLSQLSRERNPEVKGALARAVSPIQDLRAVPVLVRVLDDEDRSVARAAALALRDFGAALRREGSPQLVDDVAAALRTVLRRTRAGLADEPLRAAVVDAMASIARADFNAELQPLLNRRETTAVRRSAIRALAAIGVAGQPEIADSIVPWLEDGEATVRLEAANALRDLRRPESIPSLLSRLSDRTEPDPSVRDAAWDAIAAQLPDAPATSLASMLPQFPIDASDQSRTRRLILLRALEEKATGRNDVEQLAQWREDIGRTLISFSQPAATEAIESYRQALENYRALQSPVGVLRLTEALMEAYLRAGRYADAITFAGQTIASQPANAEELGRLIRKEATRLVDAKQDAAAQELISLSEGMSPPLPDSLRRQLSEIEAEIRRRQLDNVTNGTTRPQGPRSGSPVELPAGPVVL